MIKKQIAGFLLRWMTSCLAMYVCINMFATVSPDAGHSIWLYPFAGFIFAVVNSVVKPLATLFALPFLLLTMGLFTIVLNAAMVALAIWLTPGVEIGLWGAVGGSLAIALVNYLVNLVLPDVK